MTSRKESKKSGIRRHPSKFNAITGLSERGPYNVLDLGWPRNWPPILRAVFFFIWFPLRFISSTIRFLQSQWVTSTYYSPLAIFSHRYHLIDSQAALLGEAAKQHVDRLFSRRIMSSIRDEHGRRKSAATVLGEDLKFAKDMSYLLVRGLPTVTDSHPFPDDNAFPEKDRDNQSIQGRIKGNEIIDPALYANEATQRQQNKRKLLDLKFQHADYLIAGLAEILDCKVAGRRENAPLAQSLLTTPHEQQSSDLDNADIPLRFHQSTAEKDLPALGMLIEGESCVYRALLCIKNLLRTPIYVITVKDVIDRYLCPFDPRLKAEVIEKLCRREYTRRGPRYSGYQFLQAPRITDKTAILARNFRREGDWVMVFDHERVRPGDAGLEKAIIELREAIQRARRDAIRVIMQPGDVLLIDNLRAMVSRREYYPLGFVALLRALPSALIFTKTHRSHTEPSAHIKLVDSWPFRPHRWLRAYYFFRKL